MADPDSSFTPCTNAEVQKEASLFEHPGVVQNVIAYLDLLGVLSLGRCSKYLNYICESDCTWKLLYKRKWGQEAAGESSEDLQTLHLNKKRWKPAYIARQKEHFAQISEVLLEVENCIRDGCLCTFAFHNGINKLKALYITYDDIYSFFLSKKLNVIFTMIGLYYAFYLSKISGEDLKKAMTERGVIDKVVCARWSYPRSLSYGFYMPEENNVRVYSLGKVVEKQMSVLCLIHRTRHASLVCRDVIENMTISDKIPEPMKCMTCTEKEHVEKVSHVREPSGCSA